MLIEQKTPGYTRMRRALALKCPNCGFGNVFYKAKFPGARPRMRTTCEHCGSDFTRQEGFYRGAVYLSYGLTLLIGVLAYLSGKFLIFGLSERDLFLIALTTMLFMSVYSYRVARVIWLSREDGTGGAV